MRRLMLLRHAKAEPANGSADFDRPLATKGRAAARAIGAFMAANGLVPDIALVSSARRATQTWHAVAANLADSPPVQYDRLLYEASDTTLLATLRDIADRHRSAIVVGHNPELEELAQMLACSGSEDDLARLHEKLPTGALAVIDFATAHWRAIAPESGRLTTFVTPADLAATGE